MGVVDEQQVRGAQLFLEAGRGALLKGAHEARQEAFGGQVDHPFVRPYAGGLPGESVQKVGLAEAVGRMEDDRVEVAVGPGGDAPGHGVGELIGRPRHESVEGVAFLQPGWTSGTGRGGYRRRFGLDRLGRTAVHRGEPQAGVPAAGFQFELGFEAEAAAVRIVLGPDLGDAPPGVAPDPIGGDPRGGHQEERPAGLLQKRRLPHPGAERRFAQFALQRRASLQPNDTGR